MAMAEATVRRPGRRLALVLGNGAYTQKAPLSKTVGTAAELQRKLISMDFEVVCAFDQSLVGMRAATLRWLELVDAAGEELDAEVPNEKEGLLLFFAYCGHGAAGRLFPVDAPKRPSREETYCFFEDFLYRLYDVLSFNCRLRRDFSSGSSCERPAWEWRRWSAQVVSIIESCRRLSKDEKIAFDQQRARIASGRRHLLPCVTSLRPDLAPMGGAEWDAARLSFLSQLGSHSPQLLLALSSESTTPSYDVVYLRSIVEQIDKPVRLGGILERASLDTLRRTGHKQRPVLLCLCDQTSREAVAKLQDLVLMRPSAGPPFCLSRSASSGYVDRDRPECSSKVPLARGMNSRMQSSLPVLVK